MGLITRISPDSRVVTIYISGHFDRRVYPEFLRVLRGLPTTKARYTIDMSRTEPVRDSGLKLLSVLREHVGEATIDVINCSPQVRAKLVDLGIFHVGKDRRRLQPKPAGSPTQNVEVRHGHKQHRFDR